MNNNMARTEFILPYFISFPEWIEYQRLKKNKKITEIETLLVIQNSKEDAIFNNIIKKLVRINIFDLSRISYLVILFLSPYIVPYLKEILKCDIDTPESVLCKIYDYPDEYQTELASKKYNEISNSSTSASPMLDKTIIEIITLVLNKLITMELFLNIHVFILYFHLYNLNLHNHINISSIANNVNLNKISCLVEIITSKIPKSAITLLIMKTMNKLGKWNTDYFNNNVIANLKEDYIDSKMTEITKCSRTNNQLLDEFIIQIMNMHFDFSSENSADAGLELNDIWNICKNHMVSIVRNMMQIFKVFLEILITQLAKEQPEMQTKAMHVCKSILNFLEIELELLDTKLAI